ncbi:MAG: hypothetical protein IBX60_01255 [Candidatus Aminicenantes bacterium]|nr:hypothetical protein [Candidatus Aminicenantes bacterium]
MINPIVYVPNNILEEMKKCKCGLLWGGGTGECKCGFIEGSGYPAE